MEMTVKQLTTPEEFLEMDNIATVSFVISRDPQARYQSRVKELENPILYEAWGVFDEEGNMGAAMINNSCTVEFDGQGVKAGGIGGVCSLPELRSKGGVRAIFRRILQDEYGKGYIFSYLFPFSYPYYRQFGYELLHTSQRYIFPIDALKGFTCDCQVSMCRTKGATEDMYRVYEQFRHGKNLAMHREERQWGDSQADPYIDRRYKYIFFDEQKNPRAYIVFHPERKENDSHRTIAVNDLAFLTPEDLCQMLGFLYRLRAQYAAVDIILPEEVPLMAMLPDGIEVKHSCPPQGQLRVVNVQETLKAMRYPQEKGSAVIAVEDSFLSENTGTYCVSFEGGKALRVEKVQQMQPDIQLSIQRFSQMVTGFLSFSQAVYVSGVQIFKNHDVLEKIFVHKSIYFRDHF